jgi:transposase
VSDDEWELLVPYLTLLPRDALQRRYELRAVFNAARWIAHTGAPWRYLPLDFPPWPTVYQQVRRWMVAGSFEAIVHDLRLLLRVFKGRAARPSAAILDARVLQASPESGARAGYDGHKRRKGSEVHAAVDTLGHLLALAVTPANEDERTQVRALPRRVQEVSGQTVAMAFVDQGYTARRWPRRRPSGASGSSWSSWRRPSAALCCCPGAGWWSAASLGRPASVAWRATTSDCPTRWRGCTSWPSPVSCSIR